MKTAIFTCLRIDSTKKKPLLSFLINHPIDSSHQIDVTSTTSSITAITPLVDPTITIIIMKVPFYRINAFVDIDDNDLSSSADGDDLAIKAMHTGNPAAVILLTQEQDKRLTDDRRQAIAHELNLSETSFVVTDSNSKNFFGLRWFTPKVEVNLCGHATLAAMAAILNHYPPITSSSSFTTTEVQFQTLYSGTLTVTATTANNNKETTKHPDIRMHFPAYLQHDPLTPAQSSSLLSALRIPTPLNSSTTVHDIFKSDYDIVVHLSHPTLVSALSPDFSALRALSSWATRGIIACALDNEKKMIVSRFFAPAVGIDEDPVTGSAHCALAPLFVDVGECASAKQVSQRVGRLNVERRTKEVVVISGRTSVVVDGFIEI